MSISPTQLFAGMNPVGSRHCFYCGGKCAEGQSIPASEHVKKSFTSRDTVAGGDLVCLGCVAAMDERATIQLADGTVREKQKVRCYSWVITHDKPIAATKSHRQWLLETCLSPPEPPFVIMLSDSGQKHLLYRAAVCHSREVITITLEDQRITYTPDELRERLLLCKKIAAATGKPAILESPSPSAQMRVLEHFADESLLADWLSVREHPLTRLAAWLTPASKECQIDFPKPNAKLATKTRRADNRTVQATLGGLD